MLNIENSELRLREHCRNLHTLSISGDCDSLLISVCINLSSYKLVEEKSGLFGEIKLGCFYFSYLD